MFGHAFTKDQIARIVCYADLVIVVTYFLSVVWIGYKERQTKTKHPQVTAGAAVCGLWRGSSAIVTCSVTVVCPRSAIHGHGNEPAGHVS